MDLQFLQIGFLGILAAISIAAIVSIFRKQRLQLPPGPFSVPILGNWLEIGNDVNHRKMAKYAEKLGEIFLLRMGQRNIVVVSSSQLAKDVLQTQGAEFGSRSGNIVFDIFTGKGQDLVFAEYGEHWRKMRRITTISLFTNKVVQQHSRDFDYEAERLVEGVKSIVSNADEVGRKGVVLRNKLEFLMYNIIYKIMFDHRFENEEDPLFVKVRALNMQRSRLAQSLEYNFVDFNPMLRPFMGAYLNLCKEVKDLRFKLYKTHFVDFIIKKLCRERSSKSIGLRCGMDHIVEAQLKGEITEDNVLYMVENMNIAAIDTTLLVMEWAIAELVNHPHVQTTLRREIGSKPITAADIHSFPYLEAVIKETLRRRMPVPFMVPHMNLEAAKLGGFDIPARSRILVNAWWIANNPDHWKQPEIFRPERFLEEEANVDVNGNDSRYFPFGVGRRSCPGIQIAMPVVGITIGRLVQNFELVPPFGETKVDTTENGGQFTLRMVKHCTIVLNPVIN